MGCASSVQTLDGRNDSQSKKSKVKHSAMIKQWQSKSFDDTYDIVKKLGEGSTGTVDVVKLKSTDDGSEEHQLYCAKSLKTEFIQPKYMDELRNEIHLLSELDHPNIVKAIETFEKEKVITIVMELCSGGDLYEKGPYTEAEAKKIIALLLSAVAYMHKRGVIHRDIKYENVMFEDQGPSAQIKLIDFGISKKFSTNDVITDGVGTFYTMAPEIFTRKYSSKVDIWAIGVIAYMLLCDDDMPFVGDGDDDDARYDPKNVVKSIKSGKFNTNHPKWKAISVDAKTFVKNCLQVEPGLRWSAEEAQKSKWITSYFNNRASVDLSFVNELPEYLNHFSHQNDIKKLGLTIIAHRCTTDEVKKLRSAFTTLDNDHGGSLNKSEFMKAFDSNITKYTEEELSAIFDSLDTSGDGVINYTEFLAATIEAQGSLTENKIRDAFDTLDTDGSGTISTKNLKDILGEQYDDEEEINRLIQSVDVDGNGEIDFDEFLSIFQQETANKVDEIKCDMQQG